MQPSISSERAAYTVAEFCDAYRLSRGALYALWRAGRGPRYFRIGTKILISAEDAALWRRDLVAAAQEGR